MIFSFVILVGSGCSLITDPLGKSFDDVEEARETGVLSVSSTQSPAATYQAVIDLAAVEGWTVYNRDDEALKLLLISVGKKPEKFDKHYFGNTSEVGVFISQSAQGSKIEISSWSLPVQQKAHAVLAKNIK